MSDIVLANNVNDMPRAKTRKKVRRSGGIKKTRPVLDECIQRIPMLAGLAQVERDSLRLHLSPIAFRQGRFLVRRGSRGCDLLFIAAGRAKVCVSDKRGKEIILALLGPGDFFGEIALLTDRPRTADVVALAAGELVTLDRKSFFAHSQRFAGLSAAMLRSMAQRIQSASRLIADLALHSVASRVARILFSLSMPENRDGEIIYRVHKRPTQQMLAQMAGTSREVVSRTLGALQEEGYLTVDDEQVIVHSLPIA